jgi:hypothetical protein
MGHLLYRQILELTFPDKATAEYWSPRLAELNQQVILPELEQTFSQLVADDQAVRIERLELDLGRIRQGSLDADLVERLRQKLSATLQSHLVDADRVSVAAAPIGLETLPLQTQSVELKALSAASLAELFGLFLQTGRLPWWLDKQQATRLDSHYQRFWLIAPDQARQIMQAMLVGPLQRRRFIEQFSNQSHQLTLQQLLPATLAMLLSDLRKLAAILLFRRLGAEPARSGSFEVIYQLLGKTEIRSEAEYIRLVRRLFVDLASWSGLPYAQLLTAVDPEIGRTRLSLATRILLAQLLREDALLADPRGRIAPMRRSSAAMRSAEEEVGPAAVKPSAGREIPLDNAGLVLLWPYLTELFRSLELLERGADQAEHPKLEAVLLLQQLVTGRPAAPEHQLALNKLLCGVPPGMQKLRGY